MKGQSQKIAANVNEFLPEISEANFNQGMTTKVLLWDTSVVFPYYLPDASRNATAAERSRIIIDAVRNHHLNAICYIPNIVIAEVFTCFDRECYSGWDSQISSKYPGNQTTLHQKKYRTARKSFSKDIHNGALFYQMELNRYHILALDLVSPVDKYRQFYRSTRTRSMGSSDLLIGAMAMHLSRLNGKENTALLTGDRRMKAIFANAAPNLKTSTAERLELTKRAPELGFGKWGADIYPNVIDLERDTTKSLKEFFGTWPLATRKKRGKEPKA